MVDPATATIILTALKESGNKAKDLGKIFLKELEKEESKIKIFLRQLMKKPIEWLFTLFFAPLILAYSIFTRMRRNRRDVPVLEKIQCALLILGFSVACLSFWLSGTAMSTALGFFVMKALFGWIAAGGWLIGSFFSVIFAVAVQIAVFNMMCFAFLKLSRISVINKVYSEFIEEEYSSRGMELESVANYTPNNKQIDQSLHDGKSEQPKVNKIKVAPTP